MTPPTDLMPPLVDGQPDWAQVSFDVLCPCCEYNLRMLTRPLCPECGCEVNWEDLIARRSPARAYIFEHNWRKRPLVSWLQTVRRSFRPRRFWADLSLSDPPESGPIWLFVFSSLINFVVVVQALTLFGWLTCECIARVIGMPSVDVILVNPKLARSIWYSNTYLRTLNWLRFDFHYAAIPRHGDWWCLSHALVAAVSTLTVLAILCLLRQTIARRRLRSIHMVRAVAYSAAPVLMLTAVLWVLRVICGGLAIGLHSLALNEALGVVRLVLQVAPWMISVYYLGMAFTRYLRLPRAWLLATMMTMAALLAAIGTMVRIARL